MYKNILNKAYQKNFKKLNKNFFMNKTTGLFLFVEYLKYLRDSIIIKSVDNLGVQSSLTAIITTIAEFEAYLISTENDKKVFHWNNFWELVKQHMEEWLLIDDSI
jgi:hypothetical protein